MQPVSYKPVAEGSRLLSSYRSLRQLAIRPEFCSFSAKQDCSLRFKKGKNFLTRKSASFVTEKLGIARRCLSVFQSCFVVLPKPPFRTPAVSSSTVIPYSIKIPCAKPSPFLSSTVLPSFESFVILIKICPSLSEL